MGSTSVERLSCESNSDARAFHMIIHLNIMRVASETEYIILLKNFIKTTEIKRIMMKPREIDPKFVLHHV